MKNLKFWINLGLGLAVAGFFLWLFFRSVEDWGEIWEALRTARYVFLIPAVALALLQYIFRTFRWYYLLHDLKKISFLGLFSPMIIGFMGNCLLPARAGEFIRAYLIAEKEDIKLTASLASLAVDRMFDMFVLLMVISGVLLFYPLDESVLNRAVNVSLAQARMWLGGVASLIFITLVGFTVLLYYKKELAAKMLENILYAKYLDKILGSLKAFAQKALLIVFFFLPVPRREKLVAGLLPDKFREKIIAVFMGFTEGLHIFKNGRHVLISVVVTILQWTCGALCFYPLYYAFGIEKNLSVMSTAAVLGSAAVGVAIPTPGYAGPFHFFVQIGVQLCDASISDPVAKVFALVAHAVMFFPVILIGIAFAIKEGVSLTQIEAGSKQLKESAE